MLMLMLFMLTRRHAASLRERAVAMILLHSAHAAEPCCHYYAFADIRCHDYTWLLLLCCRATLIAAVATCCAAAYAMPTFC